MSLPTSCCDISVRRLGRNHFFHSKTRAYKWWMKRLANRRFRRKFNEQVRNGLEAWSEFQPTLRCYFTIYDWI